MGSTVQKEHTRLEKLISSSISGAVAGLLLALTLYISKSLTQQPVDRAVMATKIETLTEKIDAAEKHNDQARDQLYITLKAGFAAQQRQLDYLRKRLDHLEDSISYKLNDSSMLNLAQNMLYAKYQLDIDTACKQDETGV